MSTLDLHISMQCAGLARLFWDAMSAPHREFTSQRRIINNEAERRSLCCPGWCALPCIASFFVAVWKEAVFAKDWCKPALLIRSLKADVTYSPCFCQASSRRHLPLQIRLLLAWERDSQVSAGPKGAQVLDNVCEGHGLESDHCRQRHDGLPPALPLLLGYLSHPT